MPRYVLTGTPGVGKTAILRLAQPTEDGPAVCDRSPVCTLALSRYADIAPSQQLTMEIDRIIAQRLYEPTVFFVRHQGSVQPTPARRISFDDALRFELIHEQTYTSAYCCLNLSMR